MIQKVSLEEAKKRREWAKKRKAVRAKLDARAEWSGRMSLRDFNILLPRTVRR